MIRMRYRRNDRHSNESHGVDSKQLTQIFLLCGLCLGLSTPAAKAQDFDRGLSAYNFADYKTAYSNWLPLSVRGDAKSQAALGYLYYRGLGLAPDPAVAAVWFRRAADRGQATAQFFLGLLYLEGRGVDQDITRAHMWCDIAISRGFADGLACREQAALQMTNDDFDRSSKMVVEWRHSQEAAE